MGMSQCARGRLWGTICHTLIKTMKLTWTLTLWFEVAVLDLVLCFSHGTFQPKPVSQYNLCFSFCYTDAVYRVCELFACGCSSQSVHMKCWSYRCRGYQRLSVFDANSFLQDLSMSVIISKACVLPWRSVHTVYLLLRVCMYLNMNDEMSHQRLWLYWFSV